MTAILIVMLTMAPAGEAQAPPEGKTGPEATAQGEYQELEPHKVREVARLLLRREATVQSKAQQAGATRDLCKMYVAVCRDEDMALRARLKLKAKLYSRLVSIKKQFEYDLRQESNRTEKRVESPSLADSRGEDSAQQTELLQQQVGAGGGGLVRDDGQVLVELIQKTVSPQHWDVNGGPGSIYYWPNLHVLVVRASGDAHGRVGGLFDGLRRP